MGAVLAYIAGAWAVKAINAILIHAIITNQINRQEGSRLAGDRGAGGILFVSGPAFDREDQLTDLEKREGKVSIPVLHISRKAADRILESTGKTIESLEKHLNEQAYKYK